MAFSAGFVFVDLKPKRSNSKIIDTAWWTGVKGASDLEELVDKAKDGIEFELPMGEKVPFKLLMQILPSLGPTQRQIPRKVEGIKVDAKAKSLLPLST